MLYSTTGSRIRHDLIFLIQLSIGCFVHFVTLTLEQVYVERHRDHQRHYVNRSTGQELEHCYRLMLLPLTIDDCCSIMSFAIILRSLIEKSLADNRCRCC